MTGQAGSEDCAGPRAGTPSDLPGVEDTFEPWERYPADEAEENIGYQKLAWYAAPFGDAGWGLVLLAFVVNGVRRLVRALIRLALRWPDGRDGRAR